MTLQRRYDTAAKLLAARFPGLKITAGTFTINISTKFGSTISCAFTVTISRDNRWLLTSAPSADLLLADSERIQSLYPFLKLLNGA